MLTTILVKASFRKVCLADPKCRSDALQQRLAKPYPLFAQEENHLGFPDLFRASIQTFLLCHNRLAKQLPAHINHVPQQNNDKSRCRFPLQLVNAKQQACLDDMHNSLGLSKLCPKFARKSSHVPAVH